MEDATNSTDTFEMAEDYTQIILLHVQMGGSRVVHIHLVKDIESHIGVVRHLMVHVVMHGHGWLHVRHLWMMHQPLGNI